MEDVQGYSAPLAAAEDGREIREPASPEPGRFPHRRFGTWAFWFLVVLYIAFARGHFWTVDEIAAYHQTRSLWERGDLSTPPLIISLPGRDGRYYSAINAGQAILALPFYGLGKLVRITLENAGAGEAVRNIAGPVLGDVPGQR